MRSTCQTKKVVPMINSCQAAKVVLRNGTRISCTFIPSLYGTAVMDIWATDKDGTLISSRSIFYKEISEKVNKLRKAINELKVEVIGYEISKLSAEGKSITDLLKFIEKRYSELSVQKS